MELNNDFRVPVSVPETWKVLTDLERIAPMLPGAQLQEVEGDEYRGVVKVKVGPISAQYKGTATFVDVDEAGGKVVLKATGRDTRGQGNASALITATMTEDGDGTKVTVSTDLTITGKVAQFGRGVLADVSGKMIGQFVDALEADLLSSGAAAKGDAGGSSEGPAPAGAPGDPAAGGTGAAGGDSGSVNDAPLTGEPADQATASSPGSNGSASAGTPTQARRIDSEEVEPLDLLAVAGGSAFKRLAPVAVAVALLVVVLTWRRKRRSRPAPASAIERLVAGAQP
jgi:carbon monoxide dehydrogenase subunit G